jgi:hypothetical protein
MIVRECSWLRGDRGTRNPVARWPLRTVISTGPVQGGQHASDDICSCDLEPAARSHFRRFAGNPDCPASGRSCERCRCRERHAGACVRLALPSITHRTCSRAEPPKAARSRRLIIERKTPSPPTRPASRSGTRTTGSRGPGRHKIITLKPDGTCVVQSRTARGSMIFGSKSFLKGGVVAGRRSGFLKPREPSAFLLDPRATIDLKAGSPDRATGPAPAGPRRGRAIR